MISYVSLRNSFSVHRPDSYHAVSFRAVALSAMAFCAMPLGAMPLGAVSFGAVSFGAMPLGVLVVSSIAVSPNLAAADGPKDNLPDEVRRVPPLGVELTAKQRNELQQGLSKLVAKIESIKESGDANAIELLPDVQIFSKAVNDGILHQELFSKPEIVMAAELLVEGMQRAQQLEKGEAPWTRQTGLVVRGFVSRLDQSVQPYGLLIPDSYSFDGSDQFTLDIWLHGRGETVGEVKFLKQRMNANPQFQPDNTFVLQPYGRYSNAFKFAGEVDVMESLAHVKANYRIDEDRVGIRGFSMGGAGCWQFAVHFADQWYAANPGAGFSETAEFLKFFQQETLNPTWYEKRLWRLYDCTGYALNLFHCPTVAYSGELDIQKQAADIMATALVKSDLDLLHLIGPDTKHKIHADSKIEIQNRMDRLSKRGRANAPRELHLVTYTLKYNQMHWLTINGLAQHWERAQVDAVIQDGNEIEVNTENVTSLTFSMPAGSSPFHLRQPVRALIDQQSIELPRTSTDLSWNCRIKKVKGKWSLASEESSIAENSGLVKRHNLQGPIDDAFMDSFIFVRPTGKSPNQKVQQWVDAELNHAIEQWRQQFRGDAQVKNDVDIDEHDIASANLVLFGDPHSNQLIKKLVAKTPFDWDAQSLSVRGQEHPSTIHVLLGIYPNPLNQERYVVFNSGFTYREYAYLNNARQVPMLPDWAVVDVSVGANSVKPGRIVDAGFFNEQWQVKSAR